jgi:hypothetical protein
MYEAEDELDAIARCQHILDEQRAALDLACVVDIIFEGRTRSSMLVILFVLLDEKLCCVKFSRRKMAGEATNLHEIKFFVRTNVFQILRYTVSYQLAYLACPR